MSMTKYGTFVMYQNKETDEVIEIPLADEETLNKYASDRNWREVGNPDEESSTEEKESSVSTE
jgi:hypothetical protein